MENWGEKIRVYALKNAVEHDGKAQEGSVISSLFSEGLKREEVKGVVKDVKRIVSEINSLKLDEQKKIFSEVEDKVGHREEREGLQELENVMGKVVLRLAPYPSGALHIGNAKTYLLNALYAEKYKGRLLLIIDDTIGSEEKQIAEEAYDLIPEAFDWLKVKYEKPIVYKSDRLKIYYEYAEKIIKIGRAYVCSCSQEEIKENRTKMRECACRQYPIEEQMKRWKKMFESKPGSFTLRIKTSMQNPNPAFRDRVLFRISDREHPRVKSKYRVWPLLEFSWAIDDHLLGITHVIRGKELMIESEMEKEIWKIFGWKSPELIHVGTVRLEGVGAKISKSKAQKEVKSGKYSGWDDPRTWSVQSLRRRGFVPESIRKFVEEIGLNQKEIIVPIDALYSINRKMIDERADRYYFVSNPIEIDIDRIPVKGAEVNIHPEKNKKRKISLSDEIFISQEDYEKYKGKEIRLMHLFNVKLSDKLKAKFTSLENKNIQKIHWVSEGVSAKILMPDGVWIKGIAEKAVSKLEIGEVIQFERFGFARLDKKGKEYEFWFTHK